MICVATWCLGYGIKMSLLTFSRSRSVDRDELPRKMSHVDDRSDPVENGTQYEEDGSQQ